MISARNLTKYYGDKCVVQDLDFDIQPGEVVGFLGLNGAGKTTTLRMLSCLLLPSSGSIHIDDLEITEKPYETRKNIGFLPEIPPLYGEMTVEGYLLFSGRLRGMSSSQARKRVDEVVETTQTQEVRHDVIANLSHGFKQRVGIGQAIIHEPRVLILDEPIKGLDPRQIVQMRQMVRALGGKHTVLVSSHILSEISQTCDRILVIDGGKIVAAGSEKELTASLGGGTCVRLQVRGNKENAVSLIKGLENVKECNPLDPQVPTSAGESDGVISIEVTADADIREQLGRELIQAGFGLLQLTAVGELESVFLKLTQDPNH